VALTLGLVATIVLIALTQMGGDLATLWENGHWTVSASAAFAAAMLGRRTATGVERRTRSWAAAMIGMWLVGAVVVDVDTFLGVGTFPGIPEAMFVAAAVPLAGWIVAGILARSTRIDRWSGLIDGAAVVVAVGGLVVVAFSGLADQLGGLRGVVLLAFPAIYMGGAGAALVILLESGVRSAHRSTLALIVGVALFGVAWTAWIGLAASGIDVAVGAPQNALYSLAVLLAGAGAATWSRPVGQVPAARGQLGPFVPVVTALAAAVAIIALDDRIDGITEIGMRLAIAATIVLIVLRQTLLLRDRRAVLTRIEGAKAEADAATTAARRSTELLSAAEERFRRLVEQIPAVVYVDQLGDERTQMPGSVYVSPRVTALTGFTPAELAADRTLWDSRIHPEDQAPLAAEWDRHARDGAPFTATYRFQTRDGRMIWLAEDAEIILGSDGEIFSQGLLVDVTERRETEGRLRQAQKMEAVGQLAGGVAHDFNNLLTVITGHAGLLLETTTDPSSRIDVEAIAAAATSSAGLVGQLLAFGRRTMLRPEVTDLSSVVDDVLPMLRRLLPASIEIETQIRGDLPAVRVDPGQIQQVLLNLAINGRDAMPAGGRLRIETTAREIGPTEAERMLGCRPGAYVELTIADDGVGMDAATRDRIFEPFFTTKAAGRGTGLGLATVYGIVKQSDGYIALETAVNRGSTFRVLIPASGEAVVSQPAVESLRSPRGHERIVLCEDEAAVRDLVAAVLDRSGYTVATATTPAEALLLLADRSAPADLLLTDVVMPGMSGPDLALRARSLRPDLRVLMMSGYSRESLDREAIGQDAAFLPKPFTPARLSSVVRNVLDGLAADGDAVDAVDPAGGRAIA
jgi:PAS domain S-box-containing protein